MIRADQIPPEVVEAAARECELFIFDLPSEEGIRLALAAALSAWPGMWVEQLYPLPVDTQGIILPLPQENTNAEA